MADEIKLKAPTVEQQVVVNISGEDKLEKFADTLDKISKGRGLQKYWKDQQTLINDTIKAYNNFNKSTSQTDATELIKTTNALKAMAGVDISTLIPDFDKFTSALSKAEGIAGHLTDAFTEKAFRDAFSSFETLKAYGLDLENFFKHFEFNADVDKLVSELNNANDAVSNLKSKVTQLEDKLEESESGNGIRAVREECENLRWEIERIRDEAAETFSAFLTSNNINAGSYQYEEFFERIREGSLTAQEAIAEFKRDYSYLLEGGASFNTTQLQDFSRRLDDVLKRITDVSEKIDYISSNGVRVSDFGGSGSGNFEELANVVNQIENTNINGSASTIYESLSKILTSIKEIGQCDTDNLYHLYSTIRNLAQLNDLKVNKASLDNLADCLERICRIDNSSALTNLSLVNFKNFNDLHISKASLNNLAEYLPQISNIDVGTLTALASLDFDKLNSLHIDKDSMKNLFSFVEGLRNATGLTDFTTENKNVESSADASTSSLKTEAELMESIATNAEKAAKAKKEFVEANKELAKATEISTTALSKENGELGEIGNKSTIKDTFQGDKIEQATTSAKELDKTLEAVEIPKESFDEVISKFNIIEEKAKNIVKITKDMHRDSDGKPIESYNVTYKDGSNESYGESSNPQLLRSKDVLYDAKESEKKAQAEQKVTEAMAKGREQSEKARQSEQKRQELAQNKAINKALEQEYQERQKVTEASRKQAELDKQNALAFTKSASERLSSAISKYSYGDASDATAMMKQMNRGLSNFGDLSNIQGNIEKLSSSVDKIISDLQLSHEQSLSALNQEIKEEEVLQSQKDAFHKKNLNAIDMEIKKREEESSAYAKTLKSQMEERYSAISSMEKSLDNYNSKLEKFSVKPADGHRYPVYQQQIDNLTKKISELDTLKNNLSKKDIIDESDIKSVNALQQEIDELILKMNNMSAGERGFDPLGADKALEKINSELKKNSAMSKEAKRQIQGFYDEIRSGNPSKPIKDLLDDMYKLIQAERLAGREGKSFMDIFKEKVVYGAAANMAGMIGIYDIINVGRQAVDIVIDLNTQITELAKVSEATSSQIYDDFNSYADIAKEVGGTISDTISATADWSRNGYNIPDAKELAEVAMIYKNVGDGIDIDTANESLISTLRGFKMEAEDAMHIIDVFNEVSNNEAISSAGIGEALQRSAASFNAANTSLEKSVALITATRLQNWLNIWKHVLRIYLIAIEVFITMHHNIGETTI